LKQKRVKEALFIEREQRERARGRELKRERVER